MCKVSLCFQPSIEGSRYCEEHKCKSKGCTEKRKKSKKHNMCYLYCDKCSCGFDFCNDKHVHGSRYCEQDKCEMCNESRFTCTEHISIRCKYIGCHNHETISRRSPVRKYCSEHICVVPDCNTPTQSSFTVYCSEHAKEYCYYKNYINISCNNKASHKCIKPMTPHIKYGVCSECVDSCCQYKEDGAFCSIRTKDKYCTRHRDIMAKLICHECGEASKDCQDTHIHNGPYSRVVKICTSCYNKAGEPPSYGSVIDEKNVNDVSNSAIPCA